MTIEEKKKALYELCKRHPSCTNCPIACTDCSCWGWQKEDAKECDVSTAYSIAFPSSPDTAPQIKDSGERREFATGAVRDIQEGKGRCDLMPLDVVANYLSNETIRMISEFQRTSDIEWLYLVLGSLEYSEPYTVALEVAKHFEAGAKKYGEYNWQKGIPTHCYIDSAVRHYLKWMRGDNDENHNLAFVWNILCCIWTCIHKPELNDYRRRDPVAIKSEPTCATCAYNSVRCPVHGGDHTCTGCPCHRGDECYCSIIIDGDECKHYKPFKEADVH